MIDFDGITDTIVLVTALLVGDKLSTTGNNQSPSIVREYLSSDQPPFPYVTYDIRHVTSQSHMPAHEYVREDGKYIMVTQERLAIKLCCRGDRSREIISELHKGFKLHSISDLIRHRLPKFAIQTMMPIKPSPTVSGTQYVEEHSFIINATIINETHDLFVEQIDTFKNNFIIDNT